jgi:hypothetical protein
VSSLSLVVGGWLLKTEKREKVKYTIVLVESQSNAKCESISEEVYPRFIAPNQFPFCYA